MWHIQHKWNNCSIEVALGNATWVKDEEKLFLVWEPDHQLSPWLILLEPDTTGWCLTLQPIFLAVIRTTNWLIALELQMPYRKSVLGFPEHGDCVMGHVSCRDPEGDTYGIVTEVLAHVSGSGTYVDWAQGIPSSEGASPTRARQSRKSRSQVAKWHSFGRCPLGRVPDGLGSCPLSLRIDWCQMWPALGVKQRRSLCSMAAGLRPWNSNHVKKSVSTDVAKDFSKKIFSKLFC